jgi:hypothetical protein
MRSHQNAERRQAAAPSTGAGGRYGLGFAGSGWRNSAAAFS